MGRILIVDDNPDQCRPLMRLIRMIGHEADYALGGHEALARIADNAHPDLVICDVMMPDMDGAEVLRRIKLDDRSRGLPVVMYTAVGDALYVQHLRDLGADDVWLKARMGFDVIEAKLRAYLPAADGEGSA